MNPPSMTAPRQRLRARSRVGCVAAGLLLFAGCTPAGLTPAFRFQSPEPLIAQHAAARAGLRSIQAEARVDQRGDQGRVRGTVLMFVERSGRVRFDAMTQFGPVLTLTSDGATFALSDTRERKFLHGQACPINIARLLGLPVSAKEAAALLLGGAPELPIATQDMRYDAADGRYHVHRVSPDGLVTRMELALVPDDKDKPLDEQRFQLTAASLVGPDGHVFWQVGYDDFRRVSGPGGAFQVPFKVRVLQPSSGTDTLVRFQEVQPNPTIPPEAFVQDTPPGMTVEEAPCE